MVLGFVDKSEVQNRLLIKTEASSSDLWNGQYSLKLQKPSKTRTKLPLCVR